MPYSCNVMDTLCFLLELKHLEPYLTSTSDHERTAAIQLTRVLLERFYDVVVVAETANVLSNTGLLIARILPCCCDVLPGVRIEALICIRQLLRVLNKHHESTTEQDSDRMAMLDTVGEKLVSTEMQTVYDAVTELAKMLCSKLPSDLLQFSLGSLTVCLLSSLHWPMLSTAYGACLVLSYVFESRGALFSTKVDEIIAALTGKLTQMQELNRPAQHLDAVLNLVALITRHHLNAAVKALLTYPLPYTPVLQACWYRLGDDKCTEAIFDFLLDSIDRSLPYDETLKKKGKPQQESTKTATLSSLAISCALHEVLKSFLAGRSDEIILQKYRHRFLSVALVRMGSMYDVKIPPKSKMDPYKQSIDLLLTAMSSLCSEKMNGDLESSGLWSALASKNGLGTLAFAVGCIARELAKHHPDDIAHIVSLLNNYLPSIYDLQRVTVVAFLGQLVRESSTHNEVLLEIVMNNLRSRLVDSHNYVRQLCIIGLSNIVYASQEQIERYSTSVLSSMMAGMDDNDDQDHAIALAAMSGLASFLNKAKQVNIHSMFVNICLRARPCFEKEDPRVRGASVELFGALARFTDEELKTAFYEQAQSNFVSLLMHLNDEDENVRKSCKKTLREIGRFIGSDNINKTFQKVLLDDSTLHYGEFMNNLAKIMISDFPDKVNFYIMECVSFYKSEWPVIRCNAAMVSGFLMNNLTEENRSNINSEHVCTALIHLLKDSSPIVRSKAAEAISLLYLY